MIFCADTETIKDPDDSMRVWLFDLCNIETLEHTTFTDLSEGLRFCFDLPGETILYFHNLKFDGSYLLNLFNEWGYNYSEEKRLAPRSYNILVTDMSIWFMGRVCDDQGRCIEFRDSLKKIPLPVRKIAEAYKLPILKGEIDYKMYRPVGYVPTQTELDYIHNDTEIVARALQIHFVQGMIKLTAPADALNEYKNTVDFEELFVTKFWVTHPSAEKFCRRAYCGGISWVNPQIKELELGHGVVYDYNSMYPSVMLKYPFPVGYPVRWYEKPPKGYDLYIARCYVDIQKKAEYPACIRDAKSHKWVDDDFSGEIYLTSVDIAMLQKCYYIKEGGTCEILDGYAWKGQEGIFDDFINHWAEVKRTSKGAMRQLAKLMLNSLYGKFGTNPEKAHKIPYFDECGILRWEQCEKEWGKTAYDVAVACFVTAYARKELIEGALKTSGIVAYMDTDSLHICDYGNKKAAFKGHVHETDFCAWKMENEFVRAKYLRQKTYIEQKADGEYLIAACGCPTEAREGITFDNFKLGAKYPGKLRPVMRRGGYDLEECDFTIHAPFERF